VRARGPAALLAAALLVAACASPGGEATEPQPRSLTTPEAAAPEPTPPTEDEPPAADEPTPPPAPEVPAGYELAADETGPAAKRAAAALAQALTNYEPEDDLAAVVGRATDDPDLAARLERAAEPLHREGAWSRGEIVYPQLGGLEVGTAAVITVVRQRVGEPDGSTSEVTRVLDLRVDADAAGTWHVTDLVSAGGEPVERPDDLSAAAAAVLDDERIELPDTARWDIHRGAIDEPLLELMARMAERTPYGVVVLETGHSREVFGTTRTSRHAEGRAVDLYRVGDRHVIADRTSGSPTHELVRWLYDQPEVSEIGSPWALDAFGGRSFSDELHQDHLHVGVLRPDERQRSAPRR
jgi:hypothetical protein